LQTEPIDLNGIVSAIADLLFRTIGATVRIETMLERKLWQATAIPTQHSSFVQHGSQNNIASYGQLKH
jgi:hypothetical protein